jgi:hypothetical protein
MTRYLDIVSRHHADFFRYLQKRFADDPKVDVIVDRRRSDGRPPPPRPALERRSRPEIDEELRARSHALVVLS